MASESVTASARAALALLAAWTLAAPWTAAYIRQPPSISGPTTPEMWMSAEELIVSRGYPLEVHRVRTADGYVLTLQRIPRPGNLTAHGEAHGTPVVCGHGLASNSEQWVIRADDNLVFALADSGYDVWLGNYRGSFYGRRHERLSTKSREFWDFSFHENGILDQAAIIDYILAVTRRPALAVLGDSMSSTAQLVLLAERPEYSRKVLVNVLLAPPAFLGHPAGLPRLLAVVFRSHPLFKTAFSSRVINDEVPLGPLLGFCAALVDSNLTATADCGWLYDFTAGSSNKPVNHTLRAEFLAHWPAGASIRQFWHYAQALIAPGEFRKYDFGPLKNAMLYGSTEPPAYDLSRISSPVYIHYGETDFMAPARDVEKLAAAIPSLQGLRKVPQAEFNHIDFYTSSNVREDVNKHVISEFNRYIPKP